MCLCSIMIFHIKKETYGKELGSSAGSSNYLHKNLYKMINMQINFPNTNIINIETAFTNINMINIQTLSQILI